MYDEQEQVGTALVEKQTFLLIKKIHETLENINRATEHIQVTRIVDEQKIAVPSVDSRLDDDLKKVLNHAQEILRKLN